MSGVDPDRHRPVVHQLDLHIGSELPGGDFAPERTAYTGGEPLVKRNILSICRGIADIPGVEEGDEVVIFSAVPGNTPEDMARVLDTIPYEVMTSVSGRVKRIYSKE
mgnify:CR=1 FL=1